MEDNLEDTKAKFRVIQKSLDSEYSLALSSGGLTDFFGNVWTHCSVDDPFELWYSEHQSEIVLFNEILVRKKVPELTEKELRGCYEHTKNNIEKNLAEYRKRNGEGSYLPC